jgi:PncC family amidohydrolase
MPLKEMNNGSVLDVISAYMNKTGQTIAVAESVTSGELQSQFSTAKNAMQFFQGGITAYNITQKVRHLGIDPVHAMSCNCVSEIVSAEMSKSVIKLFNSDWGIGVTGYASPVPEKKIDELFAFVSIFHEEKEACSTILRAEKNDPVFVRKFYTSEILSMFAKMLRNYRVK